MSSQAPEAPAAKLPAASSRNAAAKKRRATTEARVEPPPPEADPPAAAEPDPAPHAVPSAARREDVINAYRAFLGRNPETDAVIASNLHRSPTEIAEVLARSPEFLTRLGDFAAGRVTLHATLPPEALSEAILWARGLGLLQADADLALAEGSPARLLAGLGASALGKVEADRLPEALRTQLTTLAPERTALHLLTRRAEAEDASNLARLLHGPGAEAPAAAPEGTLHELIRAQLGPQARQADLIPTLSRGQLPPILALGPEEAEECAQWLERRMGLAPPREEGGGAFFLGTLLALFLRHPAVQELLGRSVTIDQAALAAALAELESGAMLLQARKATAEEVNLAYLAILGRPAESQAVRDSQAGAGFAQLTATLIASPEFRARVLGHLAAGKAIPHLALTLEQRRAVDGWLSERLGLVPWTGRRAVTTQPLHAMALLARLTALPALARELSRRHGELWTEAEAALGTWLRESARGLAGGIDYVTGDWIAGWALDRREPGAPLEIEIHCNGGLVAFGRADRPRLAQAEDDAEGHCGFRLPWRGRSRLRPGEAPGYRFEIREARRGERIGMAFELDAIFADARSSLQLIATQLEQVRQTVRRLEAMLPQLESFAAFPPEDHAAFRRQHRILPPPEEAMAAIPPRLGLHVILPCRGVTPRGMRRALDSLTRQGWTRWTATCLVAAPDQQALAEAAAARDPRLRWHAIEDSDAAELAAEQEIAAAARTAGGGRRAGDTLVLMLPPAAQLADSALAWFAHAATRFPACTAFFCDEDRVTEERDGPDRHGSPVFRAALDAWELPRRNPCGEVLCARGGPALAEALAAAEAAPADRAPRRWVAWAALAAKGPVAHIPRLLVSVQDEALLAPAPAAPPDPPAGLLRPLLRKPWLLDPAGVPEGAETAAVDGPITVIVPTRNGAALLADALGSLTAKVAAPERLDLLVVDNGSDQATTLDWLAAGEREGRFRVLRVDEPFNWSRLNNLAVAATPRAEGGLLLFLNDDTRMLTEGWDRRLRGLLADPEAGAVGARLVYEDLTLQHAGVVIGTERLAAHEGVGAPMDAEGPEGRWQRLRQAGAVTGAFLACRREVFERAGPFDEQGLGVTFNDVDFCLAVRAAGLAVLYAPEIALVHFESKSRGLDTFDARKLERAEFERGKLVARWGEALHHDPGVNPHWSRWAPPFAAIREPSPAEIARQIEISAAPEPWSASARRRG